MVFAAVVEVVIEPRWDRDVRLMRLEVEVVEMRLGLLLWSGLVVLWRLVPRLVLVDNGDDGRC